MRVRSARRWWLRWLAVLGLALGWVPGGAAEPLLVIVPASHAGPAPGRAELALIFKRKKLFWPAGQGRIQPVNLPARDAWRLRFSEVVLGARPEALDSYWNELYFQGIRPPHVVLSGAAMLRFVADTRNAIGYVDACQPGLAQSAVTVVAWIDADGRWHRGAAPPCSP